MGSGSLSIIHPIGRRYQARENERGGRGSSQAGLLVHPFGQPGTEQQTKDPPLPFRQGIICKSSANTNTPIPIPTPILQGSRSRRSTGPMLGWAGSDLGPDPAQPSLGLIKGRVLMAPPTQSDAPLLLIHTFAHSSFIHPPVPSAPSTLTLLIHSGWMWRHLVELRGWSGDDE